MAAPNLVNVTSIIGKTVASAITNSVASILTNSAASGKLYKVNTIIASNIDGVSPVSVSISFYRSSTDRYIIKDVVVPAKATLIPLAKDIQLYLEEGDAIRAIASANGDSEIIISYEEIS